MAFDRVFKILWLDKLIRPENPEETNNKNKNKHQLPPQSKFTYYTLKLHYFKWTYNYRKVEAVTNVNASGNPWVISIFLGAYGSQGRQWAERVPPCPAGRRSLGLASLWGSHRTPGTFPQRRRV